MPPKPKLDKLEIGTKKIEDVRLHMMYLQQNSAKILVTTLWFYKLEKVRFFFFFFFEKEMFQANEFFGEVYKKMKEDNKIEDDTIIKFVGQSLEAYDHFRFEKLK